MRVRRQASFWTAIGIALALYVGLCIESVLKEYRAGDSTDLGELKLHSTSAAEDAVEPRKLSGKCKDSGVAIYPDIAWLKKPYKDDPNRFSAFVLVIGIAYMFQGLNTVCDVYFAGSLQTMTEHWDIKDDVAGATFMAAGGSAPELCTSLIGAIVETDIGFGTIVGSAVFNVLLVIGLCGYVATGNRTLTWWPLFRDCTYYICGLGLLAVFASDGGIIVWEAIVLFLGYIAYCILMFYNDKVEAKFKSFLNFVLEHLPSVRMTRKIAPSELAEGDHASEFPPPAVQKKKEANLPHPRPDDVEVFEKCTASDLSTDGPSGNDNGSPATHNSKPSVDDEQLADKQQADAESEDDDGHFMDRPTDTCQLIMWYLFLPVHVPIYWGIPEPTEKTFFRCFAISLIWIAFFSYILVWWVEVIAEAVDIIPLTIYGLTVLAAGTSIPDAVSSVSVARRGKADMAVSSSIGSNIFDILVGLPVPWILKTGFIEFGKNHEICLKSKYLAFFVVLLLFMVVCVILSIHLLNWELNKMLGGCYALLYFIFIGIVVLVESVGDKIF